MMTEQLYFVIVLFLSLSSVLCQNCPLFQQIKEISYDRTYSNINVAGKRPLGFLKGTVFHSSTSGNTKLCYSASGLSGGRQVELKYETIPPTQLCARIKDGDADDDFGCQEKIQICVHAKKETVQFEFSCGTNEGCSEYDVNFWFRITTGPVPANDTEGMWCQWRDNKYPQSLATLPPFLTPKPTVPTLGASTTTISLTFVLILASLACMWPKLS